MTYFKFLNVLLPKATGYALVAVSIGLVMAFVSMIFVSAIESAL